MKSLGPSSRRARRSALPLAVLLAVLPASVLAQSPNCGTKGSAVLGPHFPTPGDQVGGGFGEMFVTENYAYVLQIWGYARTNITTPSSPTLAEYQLVGRPGHSEDPLPMTVCDCHNGGTTLGVAENPATGESRLMSDWAPASLAHTLGFQVVEGLPGAGMQYGNQINANYVQTGVQVAGIYAGGKYFGYLRDSGGNVLVADMSVVNGSPAESQALQPVPAGVTWRTLGPLATGKLVLGGQPHYFLVGTSGSSIAVAEINTSTGVLTPVASAPYAGTPERLTMANVNGRAFVFSAANSSGLQVHELTGPSPYNLSNAVSQPSVLSGATGGIRRLVVKGASGMAAPILFVHRSLSGGASNIEIYDTNWLTQGGSPRLGQTVLHETKFVGSYEISVMGFGARVLQVGSTVTAYIYEAGAPNSPPNSPYAVTATPVDISCISVDPTAPAQANLTATNKSAALRTGGEQLKNYYGDRWVFQDATLTGVPLINLGWDINVPGQFAADPSPTWSMASDGTVPQALEILDGSGTGSGSGPGLFWPCDPSGAGNPVTGTGCNASVGGTSAGGSYAIGIKAKNTNPVGNPTPSTYVAPATSVLAPQARVANMVGGVVSVLTGGQLDGSVSDGNLASPDTTFNWHFTGCPSGCGSDLSGLRPNAPVGATAFDLTVTYGGGYQATLSGVINQTDLVPAFSLSPTSVLHGAPNGLTLTNQMQISGSPLVHLNQVNWVILEPGGQTASSGSFTSGPFLNVGGQASITPPNDPGPYPIPGYTVQLTYIFTNSLGQGGQVSQPVSHTFTLVDWTPVPVVGVFADAAGTIPASFFPPPSLTINTTYYVKDTEGLPNGVTYPGAAYYVGTNSSPTITGSDTLIGTKSNQTTLPWTPSSSSPGLGTFYVKAAVPNSAGVVSQGFQVIVSTPQPPSVRISGPTSGATNTFLTFAAIASGGHAPYSYQWDCDFSIIPNYSAGGTTQQCSYPTNGNHVVLVKVTDSGSATATGQWTVSIGGGGGGSLSVSLAASPLSPFMGTPVTITATATGGTGALSYKWKPGEAPLFESWVSTGFNPSFTYTYVQGGTYTVSCEVTDGTSTVDRTLALVVTGATPPTATYTIQGATADGSAWDANLGSVVTFRAVEDPANVAPGTGYTWDFEDGNLPAHAQQVTYVFTNTGLRSVNLTVVGDGVNRIGTTTSTISINVVPPPFQALIVPAAEHQPVPNTGGLQYSRTDVTVGNPGTAPVNISPAYLDFLATMQNCGGASQRPCWSFDLSTVTFDPQKAITIPPKGSWSQADVVKYLAGDVPTKGILVLKYSGGNATPLVTARVYASPTSDPTGPSAGTTLTVVPATKDGQIVPQGAQVAVEQDLPGLRSDSQYYFRLSLVNSAGLAGSFRITAVDQGGNPVTMTDPRLGGAPASFLDFPIGPYQGVDWSGDDLGLNDPSKRYVVKAGRTPNYSTGQLMAFVKLDDRLTGDPTLVSPGTPPAILDSCSGGQSCVNYIVPGARRYLTPSGAHWKTSLTVYNPSGQTRGVSLTYLYSPTSLLPPEKTAGQFLIVGPGQLAQVPGLPGTVCCDDAVAQLFATPANNLDSFATDSAGLIILQHFQDAETSTAPLIILSRTYDDEPTGTVGSQMEVYTRKAPLSVGPTDGPLVLTGLQTDTAANPHPRFQSSVNVFAYDDVLTVVRLTALKSDGTVLGTHYVALNNPGASGHFQPRFLDASDITGSLNGATNAPVSIKVEVVQGGRAGAYGLVEDVATHDPTYVRSAPQN